MEYSGAAADHPVALLVRVPRNAETRTPRLLRTVENVALLYDLSIRDFVVESRALPEDIVAEDGIRRPRVGIAEVVEPNAIGQSQVRFRQPDVLRKEPEGLGGGIPIP